MVKFIFFILLILFCTACVSNQTRLDNKDIDKTITSLTEIEKSETDINKKIVIRTANKQLEQAKQINIENENLKEKIDNDEKYVKAGKLFYIGVGLFAVIAVGLIAIKFFKPF